MVSLLILCCRAAAVESWTDKHLPVTSGLIAWYDASTEPAARQATNLPELNSGQPLAAWHDGSGAGRHLSQSIETARPTFRRDLNLGFVRFDGRATFLSADSFNRKLDDLTLFVIATPFANPGGFLGLVAMSANGVNDYVSGLNLDLTAWESREFAALNAEGAGFSGQHIFKIDASPFGRLRRLSLTSTAGPSGTALFADDKLAGRRDRAPSQLGADRLTVGARFYTNGGEPATRGFLACEIAEILIYDRLLTDAERADVDQYLTTKYARIEAAPLPATLSRTRPIPPVKDPPPVQMLVPGFAACRLSVELTNVNNVRYRPDGKLLALTYDGRVLLLADTDGDGLEDRADVFWDQPGIVSPIGMAVTPPGYAVGQGVFIACKGRVVLIVDKNGDDRADEQIVVAEGWRTIPHGVDALGVALGPDGSVYFGLGTENFTSAYLLDDNKQAHYDPASERSSILKVSPDFQRREQVCSGVRFTVGMAFNRHGDLFCTDQEGATWLANGNPFDELLHIQPGRHYGFPPRHPRHLPGVIDEPSVFDYTPQHQSTCGFCFNEPLAGGQSFGPAWWADNALVTGYSRGKLYRTTLVKTPLGYIADNTLFACLNQLTADVCLSPRGDLVVATHSGGPDWGSGPAGKGTLYKIEYTDREAPQPVRAWAASPHEVRIAFDRPLDLEHFHGLVKNVQIEYGPAVRAGDRFESLRPGYAIVQQQMDSPRALLPVRSVSITADRRSIVLNTDRHEQSVHYAAILPATKRQPPPAASAALQQMPVMELTYDLTGVELQWTPESNGDRWSTWLPHYDLAVSRSLLAGSVEAERLQTMFHGRGTLTLRTQLDLWQMLRPAVQLGSTLDAQLPSEEVTVVLESMTPFEATLATTAVNSTSTSEGRHKATWTVTPAEGDWLPLEVRMMTGDGDAALSAHWHTADDPRPRPFAQRRWLLPWARPATEKPPTARSIPPEVAGGDWNRGKQLFFSDQAQCSKCHQVRGQGGWIGPDLSNLIHRDYASVLRDIAEPSFAINPDHTAYTLFTTDGRTLVGMIQTRGDALAIGDIKGVETIVPKTAIEAMRPTQLSIMPEGLPKALGQHALRDLLTFLLLPDPDDFGPAPIDRPGAPPPRSRKEVTAALQDAPPIDAAKLKPLEIILVSGPKDHGPSEHDYPLWQQRWKQLLGESPGVKVETAELWPTPEQWKTADGVVIFSANQGWSPERAKDLDAFFARGGGLVVLHFAVNGHRAPEELAARIGLAWGLSKFRHGPLDLKFASETKHPIIAGITRGQFIDESYWKLTGDPAKITVLASQEEEGQPQPLLWTFQPGRGRVFVSILGHYTWTFDDPLFRLLVLRGMSWTMNQPTDRFNDLIFRGARVSDP